MATTKGTTKKARARSASAKRVRWPVVTVTSKSLVASTSTDSGTGMAPDTGTTTTTLTTAYNANNTITAYCHSLLNTQLVWNTSTQGPQPQWFTDLQTGLTVAQNHANIWLTGTPASGNTAAVPPLGPTVFSTVPQSIINYGNTFTIATNNILSIINGLPPNVPPTATQQAEINALINAILSVLQTEQATVVDVQGQLTTFATDVQGDNTALVTGQNNAQQALAIEAQQMQTIQAQINLVQSEIQKDSQLAMESEIGLGVAIFIVVVGIALAVATEGATLPLLLAGVGVLAVGGAIAGTVIFSKQVNADLQQLYQLQNEMSDDTRQATAIQGIINSVTALVTANQNAQQAISDVLNMWSVLEGKLQSVVTDLQNAEAAQVPAIIEALDLQTAQTAWAQLVTFCTQMQTNTITVQPTIVQPGITPPSSSSSQAA